MIDEQQYNHNQIVEWLKKRFKNKNIYEDLEESPEFQADVEKAVKTRKIFIYPRLSIDLVWVWEEEEPIDDEQTEKTAQKGKEARMPFNHYSIFFAVSSQKYFKDKIDDLKQRLSFYQFYLSLISEPKRFTVAVAVPHYFEVPRETSKFFRENGFGLWKVDIQKEEEDEVCRSRSLRERMAEGFTASIDDPKKLKETIDRIFSKQKLKDISTFRESIKEQDTANDFAVCFDEYVLDAVDAVAGVTPEKYSRRYIDRKLLNLMLQLKRVSYRERLQQLINEHLDENDDDYEFVTEVFSELWEQHVGIPYSKFLETFEPVLLHVFADSENMREKFYRDHYIHQFQVFLLGLYIIDNLYEDFEKCKCERPEISWLITSSFHDMAYPVQLYDEWSRAFFNRVFSVDIKLAHLELKSNFVDQSFLSCMGYLICSLLYLHTGERVQGNWLVDKKELVRFFFAEITEIKNHCILSSMSLLKMVQTLDFDQKNTIVKKIANGQAEFDDILNRFFVPSALAIALHDKQVWQKLRKESNKHEPPRILESIEFEKDPLTFLLIFCDNIQEWGRPSKPAMGKDGDREMKFYLKSIKDEFDAGLDITIWTPKHTNGEPFFVDKQDELRPMQFFLKQPPNKKFVIRLRDKNGKGEDFVMHGPYS